MHTNTHEWVGGKKKQGGKKAGSYKFLDDSFVEAFLFFPYNYKYVIKIIIFKNS